ncbi:MAG TPA: ATP-dependent zinc metalloprotease FtsH [Acidimicrobiales bacterium]|nr:ATP-dependent zinc metalloprotease FtsH [Acidimicrobiales bacterium]
MSRSERRARRQAQPAKDDKTATSGTPRRTVPALLVSLVVLSTILAGALLVLRPASPGQERSIDALVADAVAKRVKTARLLDEDARVTGTVAIGEERARKFWTAYPRSDAATNDLLKTLLSSRAKVTVDAQGDKTAVRFLAQFLLPIVILANLLALIFALSSPSRGGGASDFLQFGRIGDKREKKADKARTTFADLAAAEEAVVELSEVRDYLADPRAFEHMGARPPKGVLLVGPPGCGKTLLARAVAGEADANFYSLSASEFVESLVGVGAARVRDLFRQARATAPSIIFIDELDAAGRQRGAGVGGGHDEREQTLNEMLVQMDGFAPTEGVVVLAATNRLDILDPALLRAGRFDRHITVDRPDLDGRLAILRLHARGSRLADPENDLPRIARRSPGFTGADLANVVNEAALLAVRSRASAVDYVHLEEAVDRVLSGPKRRAHLISAEEKRRIAHHEAGHAVVAAALGQAATIQKVSVVARGSGIGHLAILGEDKSILTRPDMEAQIAIAMAGIAVEEMVFGHPSTGSEGDLGRATQTARDMAGRFGMSTRLGRMRLLHEQREVFLGRDYLSTRDVSQPTMEHLDLEIRRILDEQEARAREIVVSNRTALEALASALATRETLEGPELSELLESVQPLIEVLANGAARSPSAKKAAARTPSAGRRTPE